MPLFLFLFAQILLAELYVFAHDALLICKAFFFNVDVVFVHCQKYERTKEQLAGREWKSGESGRKSGRAAAVAGILFSGHRLCVYVGLVCRVSISIFNFSFINFAFSLGVLGPCLPALA